MEQRAQSSTALVLKTSDSLVLSSVHTTRLMSAMSADVLRLTKQGPTRSFRVAMCGAVDGVIYDAFTRILEKCLGTLLGEPFSVHVVIKRRPTLFIKELVSSHFDLIVVVNTEVIGSLEKMFVQNEFPPGHPALTSKLAEVEKLNGAALVSHLYRLCHKPVIVINSVMDDPMEEDLKQAGVVATIRLPLTMEQLTNVLRKILMETGYPLR